MEQPRKQSSYTMTFAKNLDDATKKEFPWVVAYSTKSAPDVIIAIPIDQRHRNVLEIALLVGREKMKEEIHTLLRIR